MSPLEIVGIAIMGILGSMAIVVFAALLVVVARIRGRR